MGIRLASIDLPVPGGPDHKKVVAASHSDLDCPLDLKLAFDVGEVCIACLQDWQTFPPDVWAQLRF